MFTLILILVVIAFGIVYYPLQVRNLLTGTGDSFLSVPTALVHGFTSLIYDFVTMIYNLVYDAVVKPIEGLGSSLYGSISNGISGGLGSVGL
jgi:hypothetical protein